MHHGMFSNWQNCFSSFFLLHLKQNSAQLTKQSSLFCGWGEVHTAWQGPSSSEASLQFNSRDSNDVTKTDESGSNKTIYPNPNNKTVSLLEPQIGMLSGLCHHHMNHCPASFYFSMTEIWSHTLVKCIDVFDRGGTTQYSRKCAHIQTNAHSSHWKTIHYRIVMSLQAQAWSADLSMDPYLVKLTERKSLKWKEGSSFNNSHKNTKFFIFKGIKGKNSE